MEMRSLRDLDAELGRHNLLFARTPEKARLCRQLLTGSVLLHGSGGMGKTTLMLHALRELGSMGGGLQSASPPVPDAGHSFYFEDLSAFIRFLGVRKRPLTVNRASIAFRWDEGGERKESTITLRGRGASVPEGKATPMAASSPIFQTDRLVVRSTLEAVIGPRFDMEEVAKKAEPTLARFSETLGQAIEQARRGKGKDAIQGAGGGGTGRTMPARIAGALAAVVDGSVGEGSRERGVVLNFLEEELAALVEECNREVYLSAASFLRAEDGPVRRSSLREFEDSLLEFLDNSNLDRLVPGEMTFWRWYIGIDHLERGVPGWTLDIKKEAVRMIYEKLSEKDGFHAVMAVEPNPALIFGHMGPGEVRSDREGAAISSMEVIMPPKDDLVRESSNFIVENVDDLGGLRKADVQKVMADLYDHCRGRIRLYYLVRSIKNLPALQAQGMEQVEPDASFLDRQLGDALGQLGMRYEYDISIKNLPAVQPLLELARMRERSAAESAPQISRNVMSWLLDVHQVGPAVGAGRYLAAMEAYGVLKVDGDRIGFFDPYVEWEMRSLARSADHGDPPLAIAFRSVDRLNRFLSVVDEADVLALSSYISASLSKWSATSRTDPGIYASLVSALEGGGDFPDRRRKLAALAASAVLGGVPFPSVDLEGRRRQIIAELLRGAVKGSDPRLASLASRAARKMTELAGAKGCVLCGAHLEDGQVICASCGADYRDICPSCGESLAPHFAYCAGCGAEAPRDRTARQGTEL